MKVILVLILMCLAYSQRNVTVNTVPDNTPAYFLEMELVKNMIKLYNLDHKTNQIKLTIQNNEKFKDLFTVLEKTKDHHNTFSIYQITITEARKKKFKFSGQYLPIKESVYTLTTNTNMNYKRKGVRIGVQANSTNEVQVEKLMKHGVVKVAVHSVGEKMTLLRDNKVDYLIGDNIEIWGNATYKLVEDCPDQSGGGFGIMFPFKSDLRDELEPYLQKYLKSKTYYSFLFKKYGKGVAKYYKENMIFSKN